MRGEKGARCVADVGRRQARPVPVIRHGAKAERGRRGEGREIGDSCNAGLGGQRHKKGESAAGWLACGAVASARADRAARGAGLQAEMAGWVWLCAGLLWPLG